MLTLVNCSLLAQAAAPAPNAATIGSVWDFIVKGGVVMIPITLCSLVALAIIVERLLCLRRSNVIPPGFLVGVKAAMGPRRNIAGALEYSRCANAPIGNIFAAALDRAGEPIERLERYIEQAGDHEVASLRKYLRTLSVIASVSTLLGLLGTIFGMIKAFQTVAASGEALGRTELLAKGIYEALITTAAGLIVAIPVIIAYHALAAKIEQLVREMDGATVEFIETHLLRANNSAVRASSAGIPCASADDDELVLQGAPVDDAAS